MEQCRRGRRLTGLTAFVSALSWASAASAYNDPTLRSVIYSGWTTAARPSPPTAGQCGLNTTTGYVECYEGSAWVPVAPPMATTLTGAVTGTGTGTVATTFETISAGYVIGNSGSTTLAAAPAAITSVLNQNLGITQGSVVVETAAGIALLAPGTTGQSLISGGSGANVAWGTPSESSIERHWTYSWSTNDTPATGTYGLTVPTETAVVIDDFQGYVGGSATPTLTGLVTINGTTVTCAGSIVPSAGTLYACTAGNTLAANAVPQFQITATGGVVSGPGIFQVDWHVKTP